MLVLGVVVGVIEAGGVGLGGRVNILGVGVPTSAVGSGEAMGVGVGIVTLGLTCFTRKLNEETIKATTARSIFIMLTEITEFQLHLQPPGVA